ncbi:DUF3800 domain-containing protein [Pseudomonas aeruginosa]|nr:MULTISPECIES: DUF3800 domain-containing protein [Pseudomonas aeruginosa group]AVR66482.1 DUF3800 domain-containing protein [Pseudomonas paraeruginosa]EIU1666242.1 DUF3800 domain-containing protein [Pseudomonas aeruginosa]EJB8525364.1 DUF3800 domain-containing protein [Pseudomonas aeruginosa]KSM36224.1 N-acetylglucosamine-6-phosphate deacetylase [Pseudomonas aeruginosa]MBH9327103.1 DUF3800 domain-containing protein [Pseudomonas aeruginosa]
MHLLYLDESGSVADPQQRYFVLGGVSVFERQSHWIETELNKIAERFKPAAPYDIELHGSPMRSGRDGWKQFPLADRVQAIKDSLAVSLTSKHVRLFAAVIDKQGFAGADPVEHAFEKLSMRFDLFLRRLYAKHGDPQRGIMLFDKSSTERRIQTLAREFKHTGHSQGQTKNYAEVPVFLDSKASRLIQLADLVAFAIFRKFEHGDGQFFEVIKDNFDIDSGIQHGLYTKTQANPAPQPVIQARPAKN